MLAEIRELGFERAELSHMIGYELGPGILKAVAGGVVRVASVHNFCPVPVGAPYAGPNCFEFSDERASVRERAVRATLDTLDFAARVGAPVVVLHLGTAGPRGVGRALEDLWRKGRVLTKDAGRLKVEAVRERRGLFETIYGRVRPCLEKIAPAAQERKLRLGFEIREDYAEFPDEVEMERFLADFPAEVAGYWHDFGHGARKEFLGWHDHAATLRARRERLIGCHIHDAAPPDRDHLPLGKGLIPFGALAPLLPAEAVRVLELSPRVPREEVINSRESWTASAAI